MLSRRGINSAFLIALGGLFWAKPGFGDSLVVKANKAFRKIGVGPDQAEAYAKLYEEFLRSRNMQVRRVINSRTGEEVPVMAKKRARRAAKKSVKSMRAVLTEQQCKDYAEYLELANEVFLRDAGLR